MNQDDFLRSTKEMYAAVTTYCEKGPDNSFGNWRFVNSELKNGDSQIVIYRRITEINLVLNQLNKRKVEAFFKYTKAVDGIIANAVEAYVKDFKLPALDKGATVTTTIFFDEIEDFNIFVYKYLLADI